MREPEASAPLGAALVPAPDAAVDAVERGPDAAVEGAGRPEPEHSLEPAPMRRQPAHLARRVRLRRRVTEWAVVLVLAALVALGLRSYVVQTFYVPSGSMLPTLQVGDRMLVDKLPWVVDDIHTGDIIVFRRTTADTSTTAADLVKRVIGLPGQTIWSRGDTIYVDGRPLAETWLPALVGECAQANFGIPRTVVPAHNYYVLGDCRGISDDSRYWGTVPQANIVGKVFVVVWRHGHPWLHWF